MRRGPTITFLICAPLLTLACASLPGFGRLAAPTDTPDNLLVNPGFEQGREGWSIRADSAWWGDFDVVDAPVRSGRKALHLEVLHARKQPPLRAGVYGAVQELAPETFPERVSGWYRVGRWVNESPRTDLYLQVVVIVVGDPRAPEVVDPEERNPAFDNYQLRYYLAGLEEPAFPIRNAKLEFVTRGPPPLGEWVHFDLPVRADFERLWGVVPEAQEVHVLFEARWDKMAGRDLVHADAYYDDLYVGPAVPAAE